jgi:MFS family permease
MATAMAVSTPTRHERDFRRYWAGQSVSLVGSQVGAVALPLVATLTLHAGVGGVSAVATASFLPNLLFALWVGNWLDRRPKRRVMIAADLARAALLGAVPVAYAADVLSLPLLVAVAFAVGTATVAFDIAGFAYLPALVDRERLPRANRALQGSTTVSQVGGPGLGGLLVGALGAPLALVADALSFLASAAGVGAARRREPELRRDPAASTWDGIRIIAGNRCLRALTAHAAVYNAAAQVISVSLVVWAVTQRGLGAGAYGLALSAGGLGAFAGAMLALRLAARAGYGRAFACSLALSTGAPLLIAALPFTGAAFGLALGAIEAVAGVGLGSANVLSATLRQQVIPHDRLARATGAYRLFMYGSIPLGSALGGGLGDQLGSRTAVAVGAVGLALSALPMLSKSIRTLHEPAAAT